MYAGFHLEGDRAIASLYGTVYAPFATLCFIVFGYKWPPFTETLQ